jgi:hypothetical protein
MITREACRCERLTLAVVIGRYELERIDIPVMSRQQRFQLEFLQTQRSSVMRDGSDVRLIQAHLCTTLPTPHSNCSVPRGTQEAVFVDRVYALDVTRMSTENRRELVVVLLLWQRRYFVGDMHCRSMAIDG